MENCFSNLMLDGGKGLLSLILSLVGLKVSRLLPVPPRGQELTSALLSDQLLAAADQGLPVWDAAVRPAAAAVCGDGSVGRGAAGRGPPAGEASHHLRLAWPESAGHPAGKSHVQR